MGFYPCVCRLVYYQLVYSSGSASFAGMSHVLHSLECRIGLLISGWWFFQPPRHVVSLIKRSCIPLCNKMLSPKKKAEPAAAATSSSGAPQPAEKGRWSRWTIRCLVVTHSKRVGVTRHHSTHNHRVRVVTSHL